MTHAEQSWAEINQRCTDWWAQRPAPKVNKPKVLRAAAAVIVDSQAVTGTTLRVSQYLRRLADSLEKEK